MIPQGLQGSHLNLSQTSAQRHRTYFLLNNKAVKQRQIAPQPLSEEVATREWCATLRIRVFFFSVCSSYEHTRT